MELRGVQTKLSRLFGRKPSPAPAPAQPSCVKMLFDKALARPDPVGRLAAFVDVYCAVEALAAEHCVDCRELALYWDDVHDAFVGCEDASCLEAAARIMDLKVARDSVLDRAEFKALPGHLRVRLIHAHVRDEFDAQKRDPREFDPALQHAFHAVEQRQLNTEEARRVLAEEFGIEGWKDVAELNPHVIVDYYFPPRASR